MYAILKDHFGLPAALFEIERETPKRYYGRVHDTIEQDKWFWLRGLTRTRIPGKEHVDKAIVLVVVRTDNAWFMIKDEMALARKKFFAKRTELSEARQAFHHASHKQQLAAQHDARDFCLHLIDDAHVV